MPVKINREKTARAKAKFAAVMTGFREALPFIGEVARDGIVQTTLAGIGRNDLPFQPYSESYKALLDAVGGKSSQVVDLRGVFYPKGAEPKRRKTREGSKSRQREVNRTRRALARGVGRRAFVAITVAGKTFFGQTRETRPRLGINDPLSEMSADLIKIEVEDDRVRLMYEPRNHEYMVAHNETRPWFSIQKTAIVEAVRDAMRQVMRAIVRDFNNG